MKTRTDFRAFDKVVVRNDKGCVWQPAIYGYSDGEYHHTTDDVLFRDEDILPYNDYTSRLVGSREDFGGDWRQRQRDCDNCPDETPDCKKVYAKGVGDVCITFRQNPKYKCGDVVKTEDGKRWLVIGIRNNYGLRVVEIGDYGDFMPDEVKRQCYIDEMPL